MATINATGAAGAAINGAVPGNAVGLNGFSPPTDTSSRSSGSTMPKNLINFRQSVKGFARANRYNLGFLDLEHLQTKDVKLKVSMLATATHLPTISLDNNPVQIQYGMPKYNMCKEATFSSWRVTFYCDERLTLRNFFLNWQNKVYNFNSFFQTQTREYAVPVNYKKKAYIAMLNNDNTLTDEPRVYYMKGIYPTEVSQIILQQQDTNVATFDVTFAYDFFTIDDKDGEVSPLIEALEDSEPFAKDYIKFPIIGNFPIQSAAIKPLKIDVKQRQPNTALNNMGNKRMFPDKFQFPKEDIQGEHPLDARRFEDVPIMERTTAVNKYKKYTDALKEGKRIFNILKNPGGGMEKTNKIFGIE